MAMPMLCLCYGGVAGGGWLDLTQMVGGEL